MERKYGEAQRLVVSQIKEELIEKLDETYLIFFQRLNSSGLGDGAITKLTQLLLLSKEAAITPLARDNSQINDMKSA